MYIVDPANPTEIKQTFVATKSSIICICYVPAAEPLLELGKLFIVQLCYHYGASFKNVQLFCVLYECYIV